MPDALTGQQILALSMGKNDAYATTIRHYLLALLHRLWTEQESFSAKRPFGNSDWSAEIVSALVSGRAIEGVFDRYGRLQDYEVSQADAAIEKAIAALYESG